MSVTLGISALFLQPGKVGGAEFMLKNLVDGLVNLCAAAALRLGAIIGSPPDLQQHTLADLRIAGGGGLD